MVAFDLRDIIDQQERVAVRNERHDLRHVHRRRVGLVEFRMQDRHGGGARFRPRRQGDFRFAGHAGVVRSLRLHDRFSVFDRQDLCLDPDPVAGIVRTAELDLLDHPHINVELAGRIEQRTDRQLAELLHRLNLKNPRHDRVPREVPLKKVFIDREILEPDVLRVGKLLRAVEHQHRVALRKNRLDLLDSKKLAHYLSLVPLFVKHCLQP